MKFKFGSIGLVLKRNFPWKRENNPIRNNDDSSNKSNVIFLGELGILNSDEVKELADRLISWYMVKFPDKYLEFKDDIIAPIEYDEAFMTSNSDYMTFSELKNKSIGDTTDRILRECTYENNYDIINSVYKNEIELDAKYNDYDKSHIYIDLFTEVKTLLGTIPSKECIIVANKYNGKVIRIFGDDLTENNITSLNLFQEIGNERKKMEWNFRAHMENGTEQNNSSIELLENFDNQKLTLEQLLNILENSNIKNLNLDFLRSCINKRNNNIVTKKKVIDFVALSLVFGKSYNPGYDYISDDDSSIEYGYFRAKKFLTDFNNYYKWGLDPNDYLNQLISNYEIKEKKKNIQTKKKNLKKEKKRTFSI